MHVPYRKQKTDFFVISKLMKSVNFLANMTLVKNKQFLMARKVL
jgi:hypothetical protein